MRFTWMAALCLMLCPALSQSATAGPYTIDDLLRLESYGQVLVEPGGQFAVVERRARFDSAPDFRYDWNVKRLVSKLLVIDLAGKAPARPLFAQDPKTGYWAGDFSPSGRRLSVFRFAENRLQLGVVELASGAVRWLDLVPDLPDAHPAPLWLDDDRLLVVTLADGGLPALFQNPVNAQRFAASGWAKTARGQKPASTLLGSGRFLARGTSYRDRRVVELNLATGATRTRFQGDVLDLALSSDHRQLALLDKGGPVQPDPALAIDPAFEPRRQRLTILDLARGTPRQPCPGCDILPSLLHWSPTGAQLLFYARADGESWAQGQLYRFDARSDTISTPLPATLRAVPQIAGGSARFVPAGWAGDRPLVFAERSTDHRRDWYRIEGKTGARAITADFPTAPAELAAADTAHFYAGDVRGLWRGNWDGGLQRVADGPVRTVRPLLFDGHSLGTRRWINAIPARAMALLGTNDAAHVLVEDQTARLQSDRIAHGGMMLAMTPSGGLLSYGEDYHGVGTLRWSERGTERVLDRINQHLSAVEPPKRVLLHSKAADGTTLNHWLLLPPRSDAPPRLIVVPYPGYPYGTTPPADSRPAMPTIMTHPQLLVGHGYAVLQPSIPLAPGPGDPLPTIVAEIAQAVDAAQASGLISRAKPLLVGHSYGGYTVLGTAALSDRFAGVVAANGIYDLTSVYGAMDPRIDYGDNGISLTIPIGWSEGGQGRMGVPPWAALARYAKNSPFYHVEDIRVPVLLVTSDLDYVPAAQAERMFLALYRLGKDAMLLRYKGESHSLISPANLRDYWAHVFAFLDASRNPLEDAGPQ